MPRYKIWDKKEDIYTLGQDKDGRSQWTAEEYLKMRPWAKIPGVKVIIGGGKINGTVFMEYDATIEQYRCMGAEITDKMTDDEVMRAIEEFEDRPPVTETVITPEERIAAALEMQCLLAMTDA